MGLRTELKEFDKSCDHLNGLVESLEELSSPTEDDLFVAEAVAFKLFRIQERLVREYFLSCCVETRSISNKPIRSKLRCKDGHTAEEILKAGNRFLDWGNPALVRNLANQILDNGYPVADVLITKQSVIYDLQRIRNYIAHDSKEAANGFQKVIGNYVRKGDPDPESAGELLLYRRRPTEEITLGILISRIKEISQLARSV